MQIVPSSQYLPFSVDLSASGLFAGIKVYDMSGGTATQITGQSGQINGVYPMTDLGSTKTYYAFLKFIAQKIYMLVIQEYTDGTYVTTSVTTSGDPVSQTLAAKVMAPTFIQNLSIQLGCEDQPNQVTVVAAQNSDLGLLLSFIDEDNKEVNILSAASLTMTIRESDQTTILTKSLSSGITFVDGSINQVLVVYTAADLDLLNTGNVDAQVTIILGSQQIVLNLYSAISIEPAAV